MDSGTSFYESVQITDDINATSKDRRYERTRFEKFLKAIAELPKPPCDGCPLKRKCATKALACEQFWVYAHGGEQEAGWNYDTPPTREPNKALYAALSEDTDRRQYIRKQSRPRALDEQTVLAVREAEGTHAEIAKRFGIARQSVGRIKAWRAESSRGE